MFGYIIANKETLSNEDEHIYRSYYCGLCHALRERYGTASRLTLNYDMTFLTLLLSSVYTTKETMRSARCFVHPVNHHDYAVSEIIDYTSDMNIILSYYNLIDNWIDGKSVISLGEAKILENGCKKAGKNYPEQYSILRSSLDALSKIEKDGVMEPDIPASCFGDIMAGMFAMKEDEISGRLRSFGFKLGKFIYIMDACMDLKQDLKHKRYNPLVMTSRVDFDDILNMLMSDCISAYRALEVTNNNKIIENILFSGIWTKYEYFKNKGADKK